LLAIVVDFDGFNSLSNSLCLQEKSMSGRHLAL
jgi:hypothetical protein